MVSLLGVTFGEVMSYILYLLIAIVVFAVLIFVHELGHYTFGKIFKFKINEFSIGFGKALWQKQGKDGVLYAIRIVPLGGYCAFEGETEENKNNPQAFANQKPWKRLIVLFSGAFFNFLSAIIFSFILLLCNGYDLLQVKKINSTSINYAYLQTGDTLYGIDGKEINSTRAVLPHTSPSVCRCIR